MGAEDVSATARRELARQESARQTAEMSGMMGEDRNVAQTPINKLANSENGMKKLIRAFYALNEIERVNTLDTVLFMQSLKADEKASVYYPDGNRYIIKGGKEFQDLEKDISTFLTEVVANPHFNLNIFWKKGNFGRKSGISVEVKTTYPKGTSKEKKDDDWKKIVEKKITPLIYNKEQAWVDAWAEAKAVRQKS
jgi:hypothetical protein